MSGVDVVCDEVGDLVLRTGDPSGTEADIVVNAKLE